MKRAALVFLVALFAAPPVLAQADDFGARLAGAAIERTAHHVLYDPSYVIIPYPGGDIPAGRGVCADVVIRAYRALGIDLQQRVHEDMKSNFSAYPAFWGLARPDANIDHRRVPNLETYFRRRGAAVPTSSRPENYRPGDIVAWNLRGEAGFLPHIGIVTAQKGESGWPLVVHNIGAGPKLEDVLFAWPMTGHFRYSEVSAVASG